MKTEFLFDFIIPFLGVTGFCIFFIWLLKENFKTEEEHRRKLQLEVERFEAEKLSQKLRDSRVEMGVRKPQSFKTKRKPQKPLDKGKK